MFELLSQVKPCRPSVVASVWNVNELAHYVKRSMTHSVLDVADLITYMKKLLDSDWLRKERKNV